MGLNAPSIIIKNNIDIINLIPNKQNLYGIRKDVLT